jgi:hypothetical protein
MNSPHFMLFPRNQSPAQRCAHTMALERISDRESRKDIPEVPWWVVLVLTTLFFALVGYMTAWAVCNF